MYPLMYPLKTSLTLFFYVVITTRDGCRRKATYGSSYVVNLSISFHLGKKVPFCLTTMLTVEEYSAVLLTGQFVTLKARGDSFTVQTTHYRIWNEFLKDNELHGPGNVAEATVSTVKVEAFKRRKKGTKIGETRKPIHTLRIGLEGDGEATIASRQLTLGIDPLNFQQD